MELLRAFLVGGMICVIGQLLLSLTKLTPARILSGFVVSGVILGALGLYEPIAKWGGAGASVPLSGFGYTLAKGMKEAVAQKGWLGIFTGGFTAAAAGIAAAIFFGYLFALLCRPKVRK